jgi:hypothetical protein
MKCGSENNYKLPHMGKEKMARQGLLPDNIACPLALYNSAQPNSTAQYKWHDKKS